MKTIFFSYARTDLPFVQIAAQLLRASGVRVFLDLCDLEYGKDWRIQVEQAIGEADRVLLFWSDRAARSRWVLMEIQLARRMEKMIVPVVLDATPMPAKLRHIHVVSNLCTILVRSSTASVRSHAIAAADRKTNVRSGTTEKIKRARRPRVEIGYEIESVATPSFSARDVAAFAEAVLGNASVAP